MAGTSTSPGQYESILSNETAAYQESAWKQLVQDVSLRVSGCLWKVETKSSFDSVVLIRQR